MTLPKVLIADSISQRGIDELSRDNGVDVSIQTKLSPAKLIEIIPEFAALIVRSETKVTGEVLNAAKKLRVVGRAGVGVDNVDVETATRRGVVVLNAPGGNTVSTAEHAFSLLLCVARKIPQADASLRGKKWSRKDFEGVELYNKTLGVIGMGRLGSDLRRRAIGGGLIDETALANALQDRHVAAAALDVFEIEPLPDDSPLRAAPNLVLTPHLGASTAEAQESVGIEIAQSIRAALLEGTIRNAVNM